MKAAIKIPAGWRRVPATDIRKGDRWLCTLGGFCWAKYQPQYGVVAYCVCTVIRRTQRPKKLPGLVEVSLEQWQSRKFSPHVYRYSDKSGNPLMTFERWQQSPIPVWQTRFWLRRGAK